MPRAPTKNRHLMPELLDTAKLIELVKEHPILYTCDNAKYRKSVKRELVWKQIADELECPVNAAKVKWRYVRDHYVKFLRHVVEFKTAKKKYKVWMHAPALKFLKPHLDKIIINDVTDSTDDELAYYEKGTVVESVNKPSPMEVAPPPIDEDNFSDEITISDDDLDEDECDESLEGEDNQPTSTSSFNQNAASSTMCTTTALELDADDFIFLGYSRTIKKFPPNKQSMTKFKIAEIIMKMETESNGES